MFICSIATDGSCRRYEHGRLLGGPVDGRRDEILGHEHGRWRGRRYGCRCNAIPAGPATQATGVVHPGPGVRAREAIQAAKVPERARTRALGVADTFDADAGEFFFYFYFK